MGRSPAPPAYSSIDSDLNIKVDQQPPRTTVPPSRHRQKDSYSSSRPPRPPFKKWVPWSVPIIVVVNILLFVIAMYINNCPQNSDNCIGESVLGRFAFQSKKENPLLGPSALTLLDMGALYAKSIVDEHQGWRLMSCMWLHAGVYHVLANMLSLIFVGIRLEQEFGFVRIVPLYIISGIGGSLSSAMFVRTTISVGASGALFGLLGGMLSELLINWTIYENKFAALVTLVVIILINLAVGILPHVDNFAHLGGFLTGFLLGFVVLIRPQFKWLNQREAPANYFNGRTTSKYKTYQQVLLLLALVLLLAGFITGLVLLLQGVDGNDNCSWCHYLSCVPTPFWKCEAHCMSSQYEKQLNLTCMQNKKSEFYILNNENSTAEVQMLCTELCSM